MTRLCRDTCEEENLPVRKKILLRKKNSLGQPPFRGRESRKRETLPGPEPPLQKPLFGEGNPASVKHFRDRNRHCMKSFEAGRPGGRKTL